MTGDNGLLQKATTAKEKNEEGKELELVELAVAAAKIAGEGTISTQKLSNELKSNFDIDSVDLNEKSGGWLLKLNKEYTIFKDGKVEVGNLLLLPIEFQQVEYIESTGTQFIDLNYIPNQDTKLIMTLSDIKEGKGQIIASASSAWDFNTFILCYQNNSFTNGYRWMGTGSNSSVVFKPGEREKHTISIYRNYITFDEETICNNTEIVSYGHLSTLRVLGENRYTDTYIGMEGYKLFAIDIYEDDILKRKLIPCSKKSDNVIGMYDVINSVFYTNEGTGEFRAGPYV